MENHMQAFFKKIFITLAPILGAGAILLYVERYVFVSTWGAWWIWGPGALLIIAAVIYNKSFFRKLALPPQAQ